MFLICGLDGLLRPLRKVRRTHQIRSTEIIRKIVFICKGY